MAQGEMLKPCPFCGGKASANGHVTYAPPLRDAWWADGSEVTEAFFTHCVTCGAMPRAAGMVTGYQTRAESIAAWNRRAPSEEA